MKFELHRKHLMLGFIICALSMACGAPEPKVEIETSTQENQVIEEEVIQFEESLPDSGLLENINPEEIITDDWSDEGDIELETEE